MWNKFQISEMVGTHKKSPCAGKEQRQGGHKTALLKGGKHTAIMHS